MEFRIIHHIIHIEQVLHALNTLREQFRYICFQAYIHDPNDDSELVVAHIFMCTEHRHTEGENDL